VGCNLDVCGLFGNRGGVSLGLVCKGGEVGREGAEQSVFAVGGDITIYSSVHLPLTLRSVHLLVLPHPASATCILFCSTGVTFV
jgi:hypothetical protein